MRIVISSLLTSTDLNVDRQALASLRFVDGRKTAGFAARQVKNNRQADTTDSASNEIKALVAKRLNENELFRAAVRPKRCRLC